MIHEKNNLVLSDDILEKYQQELETVIITKSLYLRPGLCLDDLSIETGIPIKYVKQVLSDKLNVTFFEFISGFKIDRAKRLLTKINDDHFSISNVAVESGFNTDESFVALFEKNTNMSPEKYRIKYFNIDSDANNSANE